MARECREQIYSEDYLDYLVEYFLDEEERLGIEENCYNIASNRFAVVYREGKEYMQDPLVGINMIPHCYGLLSSEQVLEATGVTRVRNRPGLELFGTGVLLGFIDTGIDYAHPAFIGDDGKSRILSIWDQTVELPREEDVVPSFGYGVEYSGEKINEALNSTDPLSIVPERDENGHGTFLAGVACGSGNYEVDFNGVAPLGSICVVKCKEAKQNLRDYFFISTEEPCYAESDIMLGIRYLFQKARDYNMPLVICLGMGTNQGGHNTGGMLGEMLQEYGDYRGIYVISSTGNEANTSHHYQNDALEQRESIEAEVRVDEAESGFTMELWTNATDLYSVGMISPDGEYSGKTEARLGERREIRFLFENTVVYIEYLLNAYENGDECIRMRFQNPSAGIWRIRVFNDNNYSSRFDLWLPMKEFLKGDTFFLRPEPNTTICEPGNNEGIITCGSYNPENRAVYVESGRGFTRVNDIKPDFVAPGVNIFGPLRLVGTYPKNEEERREFARYGVRTGGSISAAVTAGVTALLAEWAILRENDPAMDTGKAKKYLIRGTDKNGLLIPNRIYGNGILDLYGVYDNLRPRP
ncbi:MAG: S8 family peptidase [Lachnospiraceae bacterium]|nr:S8 family peptidase [Lachnospiraceae bacterium]